MALALFATYQNRKSDERYAAEYARCSTLANQFAENVARKTGKYRIAQEIEYAYNDVCLDESEVRKGLLAFGENGESTIEREHKEKLKNLIRMVEATE